MKFQDLIGRFINILDWIVLVIISLSVLTFVYGLLGYMFNVSDEGKRKESMNYILYGIIGLFVMVGIWGLVYILTEFFGFTFGMPQITV